MRRMAKRAVIYAVGAGLITSAWVLLGVLALGNQLKEPIPRNQSGGDYV
jgi:hypothetical protein